MWLDQKSGLDKEDGSMSGLGNHREPKRRRRGGLGGVGGEMEGRVDCHHVTKTPETRCLVDDPV